MASIRHHHDTFLTAAISLNRTFDRVLFGGMFQYEVLSCVTLTAMFNASRTNH